jgi:hypothetical protein
MPAVEFALALDFLAGLHTHDSSQKVSAAMPRLRANPVLAAFRHVCRNGAAALARELNRGVIWMWYVRNQTRIKGHPHRAYSNRWTLGSPDAVRLIEPPESN